MFGILGRYILREVIPPFCLAQVVFTFVLMLDPLTKRAEELIGAGVDMGDVLQILVTVLPYSLGFTIPMALLVGVLMGLGRLSGDREMVAMQACGIGIFRILSPLLVLATLAAAIDCYLLAEAVPDANRRFRETVFRVSANRAEGEIKPRVFQLDRFPRAVLYVREVAPDGWRDVFLADVERPEQPDVYVAEWGRVAVDAERRTVAVALRNGERHRVDPAARAAYEVHRFEELTIQLDASSLFPDGGPARAVNELSIGELREEAAAMRAAGISPHQPIMAIHEKFSIPVACFVFVLLAVGLGASSRREGRLASFALGIAVILAYYVWLSLHLVRWIPNAVMGLAGAGLVWWRSRSNESHAAIPWLAPRAPRPTETPAPGEPADPRQIVRVSAASRPGINLLDWYVTQIYLRWMTLAFVGLLGLFYVITFLDLSDKLFKEETTLLKLLACFWYATPQFVSYVLPVAALVTTLVTVGLLTRTNELTVMKACGISLYRMAAPILCFYHYLHFDAAGPAVGGLSVYELTGRPWSLAGRTYAAQASFQDVWEGRDVWSRGFTAAGAAPAYDHDTERALPAVAPPSLFSAELPEAELMSYRELNRHVVELRSLGFDVVALAVELHRKASFPFVTFILTLIAVPFAVTIGLRGALYGVGAGIVLAFTYWIVLSVFGALGSAGVLMPATAAWAPNLIFGAAAGCFLFSVRT